MRDRTAAVNVVLVRLSRVVSAIFVCLIFAGAGQSAAANETAVLIVDSSNSMWGQIDRRNKVVITRNALAENLKRHRNKLNLGIIAYGHRSRVSCRDIQTIVKPGKIEPRRFERAIRRLVPNGKTPIARSLNAAAKLLNKTEGRRNIILLSDGLDNCGPDPCATAAALKSSDAGITVHVIAFSVDRSKHHRLRCISKNTGGTFHTARNAKGLSKAIDGAFTAAAIVEEIAPPTPDQVLSDAGGTIPAEPPAAVESAKPAGTAAAASPNGTEAKAIQSTESNPTTSAGTTDSGPAEPTLAEAEPVDTTAPLADGQTAALKTATPDPGDEPASETGQDRSAKDPATDTFLSAVSAITTAQVAAFGQMPSTPAKTEDRDSRLAQSQTTTPAADQVADAADDIVTGAVPKQESGSKLDPRQIEPDKSAIPRIPDEIRPDFLISQTEVEKGKEGIKLKAQITASTAAITREIDWRIYQIEDIKKQKWRQVGAKLTAEALFTLPTGNYVVRAVYGSVRAAKVIAVDEGKQVDATFILNAGALRVQPALAFLDAPQGTAAKHWVFGTAKSSQGKRRLFSQSNTPDEVIRLNAGTYRLVSRYGDANALVETDITIKPGLLTEVEINHKAGIATFVSTTPANAKDPAKDTTRWELKDAAGATVVRSTGLRTSHILAPGDYEMTADVGGKTFKSSFKIAIGEAKTVEISDQ